MNKTTKLTAQTTQMMKTFARKTDRLCKDVKTLESTFNDFMGSTLKTMKATTELLKSATQAPKRRGRRPAQTQPTQ